MNFSNTKTNWLISGTLFIGIKMYSQKGHFNTFCLFVVPGTLNGHS